MSGQQIIRHLPLYRASIFDATFYGRKRLSFNSPLTFGKSSNRRAWFDRNQYGRSTHVDELTRNVAVRRYLRFYLIAVAAGTTNEMGCIRNGLQTRRIDRASTLLASPIGSRPDPLDRRIHLFE